MDSKARLYKYKKSKKNQARYNAKVLARARLFDTTRPNNNNNLNAIRGFKPFVGINAGEKKVLDAGDMPAAGGGGGGVGNIPVINATVTGIVIPMFIPRQGADFNQRVGRKTVASSLYLKWKAWPYIIAAPNAVPFATASQWPTTQVRIAVVSDTNPNLVLPALTDIFQLETAGGSCDTNSFINMNNRDRFRVIMDKTHIFGAFNVTMAGLNPNQASLGGNTTWIGKKYIKLNLETIYNATNGGTIADINSGALYLVVYGSETAVSNRYTIVEPNWRIRYEDP